MPTKQQEYYLSRREMLRKRYAEKVGKEYHPMKPKRTKEEDIIYKKQYHSEYYSKTKETKKEKYAESNKAYYYKNKDKQITDKKTADIKAYQKEYRLIKKNDKFLFGYLKDILYYDRQ